MKASAPEVLTSTEAPHQKHISLEAHFIRSSEDHHKLKELKLQKAVQRIQSRLSLQKTRRMKQQLIQMDLKSLDAYSLERVEKKDNCTKCTTTISTTLFSICNKTRITAIPAPVFLQTWNGFEIDPS